MPEYTRLQNSFIAGYVDPTLHGLTNTETYAQGLRECTNFIPSSLGYLYRRPGTSFTGWSWTTQGDDAKPMRLNVIKTPTGPMLVVIHDHTIDFLKEGAVAAFSLTDGDVVRTGVLDTIEISVPWDDADLKDLDIYEFQGSLYIIHPDYPPHVVNNAAGALFTFEWEELRPASYAVTQAEATRTQVGDVWLKTGFTCLPVAFEDGRFSRPRHYPSCQTFKGGRWYLSGTREKPSTVYASKAMDARGAYRFSDFRLGEYYLLAVTSRYVKTTVYEQNEAEGTIADVQYESLSETEIKDRETLKDVTDLLDYEVPEGTSSDETKRYAAVHEDYSGVQTTEDLGQTKVKVVTTTATTYSLKSDVEPDDGLELTESDMYGSKIMWLLTQQRVIAGTQRSIWMDTGEAATPSTFDMVQTLASTVAPVHPVQYGSLVIYVPGDRRSVRGFYYDDNAGGYRVQDISMSARTLFTSDVEELALCEGIETILWVRLKDGTLLSCTMGAATGWARHTLGGSGRVLSVVPYHDDDGSSRIYLSVARTQGGRTRTTIERLDLQDLVQTKVFRLMDCERSARNIQNDGTVSMTGLSGLYDGFTEGIGWVLHDGWAYPLQEDGSYAPGIVTSGDSGSTPDVRTGYSYTSRCSMLWQELPTNSSQTSLGMKRRASSMLLQVYRSGNPYGGYWTPQRERLEQLQRLVRGNQIQTEKPELYTGLVKIPVPSNTDEMVHAVVQADEPLPMTILAIETRYNIQEV